jgi:hypothetical protein
MFTTAEPMLPHSVSVRRFITFLINSRLSHGNTTVFDVCFDPFRFIKCGSLRYFESRTEHFVYVGREGRFFALVGDVVLVGFGAV